MNTVGLWCRKELRTEATLGHFVKKLNLLCENMTCARGLTARDRYQDRDPWFRIETETVAFVNPSETRPRPRPYWVSRPPRESRPRLETESPRPHAW